MKRDDAPRASPMKVRLDPQGLTVTNPSPIHRSIVLICIIWINMAHIFNKNTIQVDLVDLPVVTAGMHIHISQESVQYIPMMNQHISVYIMCKYVYVCVYIYTDRSENKIT